MQKELTRGTLTQFDRILNQKRASTELENPQADNADETLAGLLVGGNNDNPSLYGLPVVNKSKLVPADRPRIPKRGVSAFDSQRLSENQQHTPERSAAANRYQSS